MKRYLTRTTGATIAAAGIIVGSMAGAGQAAAANSGLKLDGVNNANCTATIKLTNYTNNKNFVPDWWFDQENDPAMVTATSIPPNLKAPWREITGVPWPIARFVGDPALRSGVADGVSTSGYKNNAQPDGFVTEKTIELKTASDAPKPSQDGTYTIHFRVRLGPENDDYVAPKSLVVTGCKSGTGSLDFGSLDMLLPK